VTIPSLVLVTTVIPVVIGTDEQLFPKQAVVVRTMADILGVEDVAVLGTGEETLDDGTSTISVTEDSVPVVK
jgi:hypothetical protein